MDNETQEMHDVLEALEAALWEQNEQSVATGDADWIGEALIFGVRLCVALRSVLSRTDTGHR